MYHPEIIAKRLDHAQARLGWRPRPSSLEQIEHWASHLASLYSDKGELLRPLTQEEIDFVTNEREMIRADFRYYCTRYVYIKDWRGEVRRFVPNVAQEYMLEIWADLEIRGRSISIQILKARQLGMSTLSEVAIAHRTQCYSDFTAIIGSSDPTKSALMSKMILLVWDRMPQWLMPTVTRYNVGELVEFGRMNSRLGIQHGTQRAGIGRGDTVNGYHLSEVADYANPEEIVDASLDKATHEVPGLLRLQESTAKGRGKTNYWHRKWEFNKKHYWAGRANFCPVFLPWYVGTDLWPTRTWLREHAIPKGWEPSRLTKEHTEKATEYVRSNPILSRLLGGSWSLPRHQQWFWEVERGIAEANNGLAKFYEEMPANDHEAFQSSGHSVFGVQIISELREKVRRPKGVFAIVGDQAEIPLRFQPDRRDIDPRLKPISIRADWSHAPGAKPHEYQLIPLKMNDWPNIDADNKLILWEYPEDEQEYWFGLDAGYGIGQDQTVLQVGRKGTPYRNDAQVAEWASDKLGALDVWPHSLALLTLFSVRRRGRLSQSKAVIECAANGEVTQNELRKLGWANFHLHIRYDKKILDQSKATRYGWYTTEWSRPMMLDTLIKAVKDGWVDINSPFLIDEMASLESSGPRGKLEAALGEFDDRVMAFGIGFFSSVVLDLRGARQDMSQQRAKAREEARRAPVWTPGWQGMDIRPGAWGEDSWGGFGREGPESETPRGVGTSYNPGKNW